jgi:FkbH-like protein
VKDSRPNIGIISDFNVDNFARLLTKSAASLGAAVTSAPFGQVMPTLLQRSGGFWTRRYDLVVVWTFPGSVVPPFNDRQNYEAAAAEDIDRGVDEFAAAISGAADGVGSVFVPTWVSSALDAPRPSFEMNPTTGLTFTLWRMNLRLAEKLASKSNVTLFNTDRWLREAGSTAFSDKLWYLSKTPYSKAVFERAADDLVATLRGAKGRRRKVVIVDLDNTLWGGVVGDVGRDAIRLGGHDPIGEAYAQFQRALKRLSQEGVVLAIASKNEEATALDAIDGHAEMILRSSDFAAWRINWSDKAQTIVELMTELNLGLESAVFIDDSPYERNRVREALPDVLVPEWPSDPLEYAKALRDLRCFETPVLSVEDRARSQMYVTDRERKALKNDVGSMEAWLAMLQLEVQVERLSTATLERAAQLLNKTNQMNLSTRRLSTTEFFAWASEEGHQVWTFRVKDRFGDYGLCGIASVAFDGLQARLVDFLLSCRAMGRGVEDAIIGVICEKVRAEGATCLTAAYIATLKNKPCMRWIEDKRAFERDEAGTFVLDMRRAIPVPNHIAILETPQ